MRNEKGISLIALVITIIVMIILAGTVIFFGGLSIANRAEEARIRANVAMVQTGITNYRADKMLNPTDGNAYNANYSLSTDTVWAATAVNVTTKDNANAEATKSLRKVDLTKVSVSADNDYDYYADDNGVVTCVTKKGETTAIFDADLSKML